MSEGKKPKYHLINDLPHIYELEDMIKFCEKFKRIYIYGHGENQEYLLKYFDMCGIAIEGYVTSWESDTNCSSFLYRKLPILTIDEAMKRKDTGIILALSDKYYGYVIPKMREAGFENFFAMSEWNKRSIASQVKPRSRDMMHFEVSLADHCNLSCQMCDHYSQLSEKWFVDMEQFEKDMVRMGELFGHQLAYISLLGGEPTLHPQIARCVEITRREFPECELIILTNGVKLLELEHSPYGNLWEVCRKCDVHITVTVYPIGIDYDGIEKKAREYGVSVAMSSDIHAAEGTKAVKISDKHTMDLGGNVDKFYCVNCLYFNKFNVLKDGRYYMCPVEAHCNIFNRAFRQNLEIRSGDCLDIYAVKSWEELAEFSSNYIPFCSYCDLKKWGHYGPWKPSSRKIEEYIEV